MPTLPGHHRSQGWNAGGVLGFHIAACGVPNTVHCKRTKISYDIEEIRAPLMVRHRANDPRVPIGEAQQVAQQAAEHVPGETLIFEAEAHDFAKLETRIEG